MGVFVLRVILIDDERLALQQLKMMLEMIGGVEVIATYQDPAEAVRGAKQLSPDAAFIDIQMPEINGIDVSLQLQEAIPKIEIVFVTAFDQYAVRAFDLNAIDYILKPVQKHRLEQTVARIQKRKDLERGKGGRVGVPRLCFMNNIKVHWPGQSPEIIKWRTGKTRELFAYLFHHRNRTINNESLLDLLWPEMDEEKSIQLLYNSIYHIRRALKQYGIEGVSLKSVLSEGYMMDLNAVKADVIEWENEVRTLPPLGVSTYKEYERVLDLYTGDYLGDSDYVWAEQERQRLRQLWSDCAFSLGEFFIKKGWITEAIRVYHQIQRHDPANEQSYFTLMKLYAALGNTDAVKKQYHAVTQYFIKELDAAPGEHITEWYQRWLENVHSS